MSAYFYADDKIIVKYNPTTAGPGGGAGKL